MKELPPSIAHPIRNRRLLPLIPPLASCPSKSSSSLTWAHEVRITAMSSKYRFFTNAVTEDVRRCVRPTTLRH